MYPFSASKASPAVLQPAFLRKPFGLLAITSGSCPFFAILITLRGSRARRSRSEWRHSSPRQGHPQKSDPARFVPPAHGPSQRRWGARSSVRGVGGNPPEASNAETLRLAVPAARHRHAR